MTLVLRANPDDAAQGIRRVADLIGRSHLHPGGQLVQRRELARIIRSLRKAGIVQVERGDPAKAWLDADLQDDFSLHHTLSLLLVEALEHLDASHLEQFGEDAPDGDEVWAADVLSVVEAILENPGPVLSAQVQQEKSRLVAAMKADGVPYEERMERLEGVTWPKPLANWLYAQLELFAERHPWVAADAIRPKGVARQMYEDWSDFSQFVRDLDLEPAEGVLLRYLSQVYKTLLQNVPERWRSDAVWQLIGYLRAVIGKTDSSLVEEWELLRTGVRPGPTEWENAAQGEPEGPAPRKRQLRDLAKDPKAFTARVRAEMVQFYRLLAAGRWADAAEAIAAGHGSTAWSAERLELAVAAMGKEGTELQWDTRARLSEHCVVGSVDRDIWRVTQTVFDQDGPTDLRIEAEVDLRGGGEGDGPLLWVVSVGEVG